MKILVLTTGGTIGALPYIDPLMPPEFSIVPPDQRDFVREFIENAAVPQTRCISAEHRDSKLIDEVYRCKLLQTILEAPEKRIVITHGTDTLLQTADFFHQKINKTPALANKVVLLTGAMTPLANGAESDGYQNLNFSLDLLRQNQMSAGVYIVLCDYDCIEMKTGWHPRLYPYESGNYKKFYNPDDGRRHCIRLVNR